MQKEAFKIMGALLVLVLAVTFTVGAVSAATYTYNTDIVDGSFALTKNVPLWNDTDQTLGYFVPAQSGVGAIRQVYVDGFISSVNLTYNNDTKEFSVVDINGIAADSTHTWTVKVGDATLTSVLTPVTTGSTVKYIYTNTATNAVEETFNVVVTVKDSNEIWSGSVPFTTGMTGEQVLAAASNNQANFTYNTSTTYGYTWLDDVNGISKDWYKTGYGYAVALDGEATNALNLFTVESAVVFEIYMAASTYGGLPYDGELTTFCEDAYGGAYYVDGITDYLSIMNANAM